MTNPGTSVGASVKLERESLENGIGRQSLSRENTGGSGRRGEELGQIV